MIYTHLSYNGVIVGTSYEDVMLLKYYLWFPAIINGYIKLTKYDDTTVSTTCHDVTTYITTGSVEVYRVVVDFITLVCERKVLRDSAFISEI